MQAFVAALHPVQADRFDHHPNHHVGQLLLAAVADQPCRLAGSDIAADRLAVEANQPLGRPDVLAGQPPEPR